LGRLDSVVLTQHPSHRDTLIVDHGNGHCPARVVSLLDESSSCSA
jgi:hypothetical protein